MAKYIQKTAEYKEGTPIRLISCGAGNELVAQVLANRLNVNVLAATETVNIYSDGEMKLGNHFIKTHKESGEWILFKPKKGGK